MLRKVDSCGAERSIIKRFFPPENFLVATPMGLMQNIWKGGNPKGLIIKPDSTSSHKRSSTISNLEIAVCRLLQIMLEEGRSSSPEVKTILRQDRK